MTFGEFIRKKRLDASLSLREFCKQLEIDPSNWSKIERGLLPPPDDREYLNEIAKTVKIEKQSTEWYKLFDLASIARKKIPDDVYSNDDVLSALPVFFRTVRGEKPSEEELENVIKLLKGR